MYSSYKNAYHPAQYNVNYTTNNQYKGFPPKMSDSRSLVSSSQPVSITDYYLKNNNSNWEYREYLKNNSINIEKELHQKSLNDVGYYQRFIQTPNTESGNPYLYSSIFDNNKPFGYQSSDLKDIYITKEQLNARLMSPKIQTL
jgi:hypothetical protein